MHEIHRLTRITTAKKPVKVTAMRSQNLMFPALNHLQNPKLHFPQIEELLLLQHGKEQLSDCQRLQQRKRAELSSSHVHSTDR
ncbi:hypothetical protein CEXT_762611 [Caerostris extrusa]|uniref:Uncharacterized protein n=1 Tax=Caerostris extrusa TaxID=172846 RepID=A0AAV4S522_CAEEX|nr:hypothetical protein CEXT_762611 [Caerostris extrusa]